MKTSNLTLASSGKAKRMKWVSKKDVITSKISDNNKIRIHNPFTGNSKLLSVR